MTSGASARAGPRDSGDQGGGGAARPAGQDRGLIRIRPRTLFIKRPRPLTGGAGWTAGLGGKKGRGLSAKRQRLSLSVDERGATAADSGNFRRRWRRNGGATR